MLGMLALSIYRGQCKAEVRTCRSLFYRGMPATRFRLYTRVPVGLWFHEVLRFTAKSL